MINLDKLVTDIKEEEGFRGEVYKDHLGFDTVGYGTKMPLSKIEATVLLRMRLDAMIAELKTKKTLFAQLPFEVQEILCEMAYQIGVPGLMKFSNTWGFLEDHDFEAASIEMLDSLWHKQTPERAKRLSARMKACEPSK